MKLTIDFETRSACDLRKHGAWVYSEHPTTDIQCLALKWEGQIPHVLHKDFVRSGSHIEGLKSFLNQATIIEAHNVSFERAIWENVCMKKYGWPPLPIEKLRCSAAKAAMHALPRSLEGACAALNLHIQKDMEGHRLMMRMCRPRAPKKNEPEINPNDPHGLYWYDDPRDLQRLCEYCMNDVIAEENLSNNLRDLSDEELLIWQLDQEINARGIEADIPSAEAMLEMVKEHEALLLKELRRLTYGAVKTAKQVEQLRGYLRGLDLDLPDLSSATVSAALERTDLNGTVRQILEIRKSLGRSSIAKYQSILDRTSKDRRAKGAVLYHGAGTGRWAGAGIQPHNFPSRIKISANPEEVLSAVRAGGLALYKALYDDDPMTAAAVITRSILTAAPGKDLIVADYSSIEGRGLAWEAGEETELQLYRSDADVYIATASSILHKPYDQITKDERQNPGKVATLACGYGGGAGAVRKFNGHLPIQKQVQRANPRLTGKELDEVVDFEIRDQIVNPWREAHPMTVVFWKELETACLDAVAHPGKVTFARGIQFTVRNKFLLCRLPSGRMLFYYDPIIKQVTTSWGEIREAVTYMTVDSLTKKWTRTNTYGGKLAENVTQAVCRDIMAQAMLRAEHAGYPLVLTVHDELVAEVHTGFGSLEEFEHIICEVPAWAKGFPIKADGYRGERYKKK